MKLFDDPEHAKMVSDIVGPLSKLNNDELGKLAKDCDLALARILIGPMENFHAERSLKALKDLCHAVRYHRDTTVQCLVLLEKKDD